MLTLSQVRGSKTVVGHPASSASFPWVRTVIHGTTFCGLSTVVPFYNRPNVYILPLLPNLQVSTKVMDKGSWWPTWCVWIQACWGLSRRLEGALSAGELEGLEKRQCVAELGMETGILSPADGDPDEKGSTIRKGNSLKFLGLQIRHKVGGAGSTGRWLRVAQWVLLGLVTIKTQTSYAAYSLHTTFLFQCLHHILNNYRNLFSREIKVADNFIDHCKNLLIDVSSL